MPDKPEPVSPLVECRFSARPLGRDGEAGVRLEEKAFLGHCNLRFEPQDTAARQSIETALGLPLPLIPNTVTAGRESAVLWLGPDEWLVISECEAAERTLDKLEEAARPFFSAVNDVSGGQTVITLCGADAMNTLAKGCSLDLHPRVFAPGQCAQTRIAKTAAVIRPLASNMPTYDVVVRRSFADYLWRWLRAAAVEYGIA